MTVATKSKRRDRNKMETLIEQNTSATSGCKQINQRYNCAMPAMKCPACGNSLDEPAAVCPSCKFALRRLDIKFGAVPLHSRYLTDRARSLTAGEVKRLGDLLRRFEKKFPQSVFSVFVTELPTGTNIREYAFWLANRAQFGSVEAVGAYNVDLLLVIESGARSAALTVGYGLEKFILEDDLNLALTAALPAFRKGEMERGIRLCVEEMTKQLSDICKATADIPPTQGAPIRGENW
jgi:uncharacterized membrane protein YgcG